MKNSIQVFAPATVANVACGFDILGFALDAPGDTLTVRKIDTPGIHILPIPDYPELPVEPDKNVIGVAAKAMLDDLEDSFPHGWEFELNKGINPGSGIGSSSASCAASVYALNQLIGAPYSNTELVQFAMEGERAASGSAHADNVAPSLLGGITMVRSYEPLDVITLPVPSELFYVVLHPQITLRTEDSRSVLKQQVSLQDAIRQSGNIAGLIAGLYEDDYSLISRCLTDYFAEPYRKDIIPGYDVLKAAARKAGALGTSISGSGPSVFALCNFRRVADRVAENMSQAFLPLGIEYYLYVGKIGSLGTRVVNSTFG